MRKLVFALLLLSVLSYCQGRGLAASGYAQLPTEESLLSADIVLTGPNHLRSPLLDTNILWPSAEVIAAKQIVDKKAQEKEIERTWYWFTETFTRELPDSLKEDLILLPNMKDGDDWLLLRYEYFGLKVQIIDGRTITFVIKPNDSSRFSQSANDKSDMPGSNASDYTNLRSNAIQKPIEQFAVNVFKHVIHYDWSTFPELQKQVTVSDVHEDPVNSNAFYGKFSVEKVSPRLIGNMTWWSDGTTAVFNIDKLLYVPFSMFSNQQGDRYVGGMPLSDQRRFVRFDPKTRIDFQAEFDRRRAESLPHTPKTKYLNSQVAGVKRKLKSESHD